MTDGPKNQNGKNITKEREREKGRSEKKPIHHRHRS